MMAGKTRPHLQQISIEFFGKLLNFVSVSPYNIKRVIGAY